MRVQVRIIPLAFLGTLLIVHIKPRIPSRTNSMARQSSAFLN